MPQTVSNTQKALGIAGCGGGLVRIKAEEERIDKFTLNEK